MSSAELDTTDLDDIELDYISASGDVAGTSVLTTGAATLSASATFTKPTYTGTAALSVGHVVIASVANFTKPTYSATASLSVGHAALSGTAIFSNAVYLASAVLSVGHAALTGSASFTASSPNRTATAVLVVGAAVSSGLATFVGVGTPGLIHMSQPTYSVLPRYLTIAIGDDYNALDGRALDWTNETGDWPNLTSAAIVLAIADGTFVVAGSVITPTGANQKVRVQPTAAQTALLSPGQYDYQVKATLTSGRVVTLAQGFCKAIDSEVT